MKVRATLAPLVSLLAVTALAPRFAAAQSTVKAGPEFRVNEFTTGAQSLPSAVLLPDAHYLIVWESQSQDGSGLGVFGRRIHPFLAPGPEFQVNEVTAGDQKQPSVAVDASGRFTVVWTGEDGSGTGVFARQFTAAGPLGPEFRVNANTTGAQFLPRVSVGPNGIGVVWQGTAQDGTGENVYGRILGPTGAPVTADFLLGNTVAGAQTSPVVAALSNGNYAVAWKSTASFPAVLSRLFDGWGTALRSEAILGGNVRLDHVTITAAPGAGYAVGWWEAYTFSGKGGATSTDYGVTVRYHDALGNPTASHQAGGAGTGMVARWEPSLAVNFTSRVLATYTSAPGALACFTVPPNPPNCPNAHEDGNGSGIFARALGGAGPPPAVQVNTYTTGNQSRSSVAGDPYGNSLIVWQSDGQDGSGSGIYAQRMGGMVPASVVVDPAGNGVLDPGVTEEVRTSWANYNGAPQAFGGLAWGYSGPSPGTYTVVDATASYGTVANNAVQSCAGDCYRVIASAPTRPAIHWDSYMGESLTPAQWSVHAAWTLHVGGSFADVSPASPFYRFIETLLHNGITGGCGGGSYCPAPAITRDQLAVFVLVSKQGAGYVPPACATPMFADVPASSPYCRWIEELARRGVVGGCGGANYCPSAPVTRAEMAVFALRTLDPALPPPACTAPMFADVPAASPFCRYIEELARRGVVSGCGGGNYCPAAAVPREQMAVFLSGTFGLRLY